MSSTVSERTVIDGSSRCQLKCRAAIRTMKHCFRSLSSSLVHSFAWTGFLVASSRCVIDFFCSVLVHLRPSVLREVVVVGVTDDSLLSDYFRTAWRRLKLDDCFARSAGAGRPSVGLALSQPRLRRTLMTDNEEHH